MRIFTDDGAMAGIVYLMLEQDGFLNAGNDPHAAKNRALTLEISVYLL